MDKLDKYSAWDRFRGLGSGSITNDELRELFKETRAAIPFLNSNAPCLGTVARTHAIGILDRLQGYARARGMRGDFSFSPTRGKIKGKGDGADSVEAKAKLEVYVVLGYDGDDSRVLGVFLTDELANKALEEGLDYGYMNSHVEKWSGTGLALEQV